jgi:hypothetical protein
MRPYLQPVFGASPSGLAFAALGAAVAERDLQSRHQTPGFPFLVYTLTEGVPCLGVHTQARLDGRDELVHALCEGCRLRRFRRHADAQPPCWVRELRVFRDEGALRRVRLQPGEQLLQRDGYLLVVGRAILDEGIQPLHGQVSGEPNLGQKNVTN